MMTKHGCPALLALLAMLVAFAVAGAPATAIEPPTRFLPSLRFGWNVDKTKVEEGASQEERNVCTESSKDVCQPGQESEAAGGFVFPETVAVAPSGNVYVGDNANHRIQEFTPGGAFVLMFGRNVNKTKLAASAPQAERDVCTAEELKHGAQCEAGEAGDGSAGDMFTLVADLAVDQVSGNIVVFDREYHRIDEFTSTGEFVLMVGGEVNATKDKEPVGTVEEKNLCTAASGDVCKAGVESGEGSKVPGAFKPEILRGNLLTVGGPEDLVYIGDEERIQELKLDGQWVKEVSLESLAAGKTTALAVDPAGNMYVTGTSVAGVHVYSNAGGLQSTMFDAGAAVAIDTLAIDAYGRLGIVQTELTGPATFVIHGLIYTTTGENVGEFNAPDEQLPGSSGISFDVSHPLSDRLYVAEPTQQEIEMYTPVQLPSVSTCKAENITATSALLCGEINSNGIPTSGLFIFEPSVDRKTASPIGYEGSGTTFEQYLFELVDLVPNETYRFKALAEANLEGKETRVFGEAGEFHTPTPAPDAPGGPSATFVGPQAAVLEARVNPEHATTDYYFEYGICPSVGGSCTLAESPEVGRTEGQESSVYGIIDAAQELSGLTPQSSYVFRLVADNTHEEKGASQGGRTMGAEGHLTTAYEPIVTVSTGGTSGITPFEATISGLVNPDGEQATYAFEVGVYEGTGTHYVVAFNGTVGSSTTAVEEMLRLEKLQPGTVYAYRIAASDGHGSVLGATALLTTTVLPEAVVAPTSPQQLLVPPLGFPKLASKPAPKAKVRTTRRHHRSRRRRRHRSAHRHQRR